MEVITFGEAWPWPNAYQIQGNVYKADTAVLTIDLSRNAVKEHGWIKGRTLFRKYDLVMRYRISLDMEVIDALRDHVDRVCLLDYRNKKKAYISLADITQPDIEITNVQEYVPDKRYQKYVS